MMSDNRKNEAGSGSWFVVAASSIGRSHVANSTICQDSFYQEALGRDRGFAIVCDGAGSAANSAQGATHVARNCGPKLLKEYVTRHQLDIGGTLPDEADWTAFCQQTIAEMARSVRALAAVQEVTGNSMACTVILMIYSPEGIMIAHVGDGRAAYRDVDHTWQPLISPHKGEEANQTVFLTSLDWDHGRPLVMSGVPVPECRVVRGKVDAFTLMTDGCEHHSFLCSVMDQGAERWQDPNQPFAGFFEPLISELATMASEKLTQAEADTDWEKFLTSGTPGLSNEPDDKTMILGSWISHG